jgi:hypothetical protein
MEVIFVIKVCVTAMLTLPHTEVSASVVKMPKQLSLLAGFHPAHSVSSYLKIILVKTVGDLDM